MAKKSGFSKVTAKVKKMKQKLGKDVIKRTVKIEQKAAAMRGKEKLRQLKKRSK